MSDKKIKRKSTRIDMTAMSDVTVLLLTFFMLTSTFIQKDPILITPPASVSQLKVPETNLLQILIDEKGQVFIGLDKPEDRVGMLRNIGALYQIDFTPAEMEKFRLITSFGVPVGQLKSFLALDTKQQEQMLKTSGIPCDTLNNELKLWIQQARVQNKDIKIAIKADEQTPYRQIRSVMTSLQELREYRYHLITTLKTVAPGN